jgi:hypothetical protein
VLLSTQADGVLVVLDSGRTKKPQLQQVNEMLNEVNAHVIGTVLNRLSARGDGYYYYYYQNSYYLDESELEREKVLAGNGNGKVNGNGKANGNGNGSLRNRIGKRPQEKEPEEH